MNNKLNVIYRLLFGAYSVIMLWLLFGQRLGLSMPGPYFDRLSENINLIPFDTVMSYIYVIKNTSNQQLVQHAVINLLGNIIMFVPLVFFAGYFQENKMFPISLVDFCTDNYSN